MVDLRVRTSDEERRAGRAATERFRAGQREWRQRINRPALAVTGAMVLASVVPALVLGQMWGYALGVYGGAFIGLYFWLRDDPPEYVARWEWGADAERATARALRGLVRAGWFAVHDVPCRLGNMDHVVIGPAGVFVLETKWLGGDATVENDEIRVQRRLDPDSNYVTGGVGRRTRSRAVDLGSALAQQSGRRPWVTAVVVIDSRFADGVVDGDRITFVRRDLLADWLAARPQRLAPGEVDQLAAAMRTLVDRADAGDAKRRASKPSVVGETAPFILGVPATPAGPTSR
ncbi:nuclease-related domain-containing protein [Patulibacter sp.]|uniref:nuclease-related domain-containing protein n=1 Tax=Patulibacter sp. TaxID=1912859 RepID=UPI00271C7FC7|nr:nuclease-related domain-containing protein [Patulibacter sp.]MDO9408999.1 nuclease-related domain-containing protein [Patulibacter sp.]